MKWIDFVYMFFKLFPTATLQATPAARSKENFLKMFTSPILVSEVTSYS